MLTLIFLALLCIYFVPTVVAHNRRHRQRNTITVVNVFLGWTFIGYVVSLAWAFGKDVEGASATQIVIKQV